MFKLQHKSQEIVVHVLMFLALLVLPITFSLGSDDNLGFVFSRFWIQLIFLAIVFYINYFILVDKYYSQNKLLFLLYNLVLILILMSLKNYVFKAIEPSQDFGRPRRMKGFKKTQHELKFFIDFLIFIVPVVLSIAINFGRKLQLAEDMKKEADNIKLKSELQHLKYQLQPHFFFNSLNNIYSMIDFAPEKAKQSIHSLSKLMRHLLYKTDVDKINLSDEIDFLKKYIDLMSLRLTDKTKLVVDFPENIPEIKVAPLLFISIVENAFKHGVSATEHSVIDFRIEVNNDEVFFITSNSNFPKSDSDKSGSGIGLENLRKSLNLLYPNKHEFETRLENDVFIAEMRIRTN